MPDITIARRRALWALMIFITYSALIAVSNLLATRAGGDDNSPWMVASGSLMGFFTVPILSMVLPLWLGRRWGLTWSWWPDRGGWSLALGLAALYVVTANFAALQELLATGLDPARFAIHFVSAALFHVTYYPLFAILLFGAWRAAFGLWPALIGTAVAFSAYHLAQFEFFPAGTEAPWLALLFVAFVIDLLLYLVTRALVVVALTHCMNGAVGLISGGTWFDRMDFVFWLTAVLLTGLIVWTLIERKRPPQGGPDGFWITPRVARGPI